MRPTYEAISDLSGWFTHLDYVTFQAILTHQSDGPLGDLVEVGPFQGRSAVCLGGWVREQERLRVVDLFGTAADDPENVAEITWNTYEGLTRETFESNFRRFHATLPEIVEGDSASLLTRLNTGSVRFIHIDGSHVMERVRQDLVLALAALTDSGVIVVDDFRTEHAPGVAAAIWPFVSAKSLAPFALTEQKLYAATRQRPDLQTAVIESAASNGYRVDWHSVTTDGLLIPRLSGMRKGQKAAVEGDTMHRGMRSLVSPVRRLARRLRPARR
jgi:hypothetical protein